MNHIEQRLAADPVIQSMLIDMERSRQKRELAKIEADPETHRDTCLMAGELRWRYWEVKTGKTTCARFAWATTPNAAGYFLTWQESRNAKGGKREYIRGHKLRKDAKESARKSYENFKAALPSQNSCEVSRREG